MTQVAARPLGGFSFELHGTKGLVCALVSNRDFELGLILPYARLQHAVQHVGRFGCFFLYEVDAAA